MRLPFFRNRSVSLENDPRWRRLHQTDTPCACCGHSFNGVFDISIDHPDVWHHGSLRETDQDILQVEGDKLSSDLCSYGDYRFVRAVVPLPIQGSSMTFAFGAWGSLKPENFDQYVKAESGSTDFSGCFSWLANDLPALQFDAPVPCDLVPDNDPRQRPKLMAHAETELARLQDGGISFDLLLDIYAAAGQDIRPHLEV